MIRGTVSSKKGFVMADPCYVLNDKIYFDFWGDQKDFADGVFKFKNLYFAVGSTKFGDGYYEDEDGNGYPVDSGTIALIPLELVGKIDRLELGNVFEIPGEAEFVYEDGVFDVTLPDGYGIYIDTNSVNSVNNGDTDTEGNAEDDFDDDTEDKSENDSDACDENEDEDDAENGLKDYCEDCDEDCDEDCAYCEYYDECEHRSFLEAYVDDEIDGYYHNDSWDDDYDDYENYDAYEE